VLAVASSSTKRQKLEEPAVVGKDVLELLSSAMYVDPLCIYREYIQNATDAIDDARLAGLYDQCAPRIDVMLDLQQRSIKIRDNGIGIPPNVFARRLTALGASKKRGSRARGFRGVGRLAGLAYCQKLIFRAKAAASPRVWEIHWDCVKLKNLLRDHTYKGDLHGIMSDIIEFDNISSEGYPEHFFEVELRGVNRIKNDLLLNEASVDAYLSQVAPVPFADEFGFGGKITKFLAEHDAGETYDVYLNSRSTRIVRPFRDVFAAKQQLIDRFAEIAYFKVPGIEGELDAIGWVLHHGYHGALPERSGIRGLRLRAGNIQIGDERIFDSAFPEPRFNAWSVGEVHLISKRIVPNGRRDDIEYSSHQQNLVKHVMPVAKQITKLSRSKSAARHSARTAESASADELTLQFSDYLNPKQVHLLNRCSPDRIEAYVEVLQFVQKHCPKSSGRVTVKRILEAIVQRLETAR
jgi:molecular chaperone HtpG